MTTDAEITPTSRLQTPWIVPSLEKALLALPTNTTYRSVTASWSTTTGETTTLSLTWSVSDEDADEGA